MRGEDPVFIKCHTLCPFCDHAHPGWGSVAITQYTGQKSADAFKKKLENLDIPVYILYSIDGYPNNVSHIVSDEGYGKNDYIKTTRPLVVITAPGPGSGKMATCLSQLYHEQKRGVRAGYAKFETFPIWNIPLKHPMCRWRRW